MMMRLQQMPSDAKEVLHESMHGQESLRLPRSFPPEFDLAIADEAHRTTGALLAGRRSDGARKVDFQEFHDDERLIFSFRPN